MKLPWRELDREWITKHRDTIVLRSVLMVAVVLFVIFLVVSRKQAEHSAQVELSRAGHLEMAGQVNEALNLCSQIGDKYSSTVAAKYATLSRAQLLYKLGQWAESIRIFEDFQNKWPDDQFTPAAMLGGGKSYEQSGDFERARQAYERLIEKYPDNWITPDAYDGFARTFEHLGETASAREKYQDIMVRFPNTMWAERARIRLSKISSSGKALAEPEVSPELFEPGGEYE